MDKELQPYQQRVITEYQELMDKTHKLDEFTKGTVYLSLPREEKDLLLAQLHAMKSYLAILMIRVQRF